MQSESATFVLGYSILGTVVRETIISAHLTTTILRSPPTTATSWVSRSVGVETSTSPLTSTILPSPTTTGKFSTFHQTFQQNTFRSSPTTPSSVLSSSETAPLLITIPGPTSILTQTTPDNTPSTSSFTVHQSGPSRSTILMIVVIIGSCIAGIAIFWIVLSKWKSRPSSKLDRHVQPLDLHSINTDEAGQHRSKTNVSGQARARQGDAGGGHGDSDHGRGDSRHRQNDGLPDSDAAAGIDEPGVDLACRSIPQPEIRQVMPSRAMTPPPAYHES
ncbi:hypothetical protein L208DRAFT_749060 [Tricholoma matsutake]|nr:hypothetical protein L208DRAFT_749060 [Tricholoma matsutake 945]